MLPEGIRRLLRLDRVLGHESNEIDDELRHHFEAAVEARVRQGLGREEATREAKNAFGDERAYRAALEHIGTGRVRMRARAEWIDVVRSTVRKAVRGVRRDPGFTASVTFVLALGIGANAVMFGVVDRLLLSPPQHITNHEDVRLIHVQRTVFNGELRASRSMTWPDYRDLAEVGAFSSVAAYIAPQPETIGRGDRVSRAEVVGASASLFPLLRVEPLIGRFFSEDEDRMGASGVVVLAQEYWEREHGADPAVLGRVIDVSQGTYTVIGVAPAGFTGPQLAPVDLWVPIQRFQELENGDGWTDQRGWYWLQTVVRLADGATIEAATAEATAAHRSGRSAIIEAGNYDPEAEILVSPLIAAQGPNPTSEAQVARWLGGVSLIVLLIACFNVANLLLARAVHSRRETAVRLALGVGRNRLISELVLEAMVLAAIGSVAAIAVARGLGPTVHRALLPGVAFTDGGLDGRLLLFALVATGFAGLATGVLPAFQAMKTDLTRALRSGGQRSSGGSGRARVVLLVGQAALSVVLLVGAGLFVQSLQEARELDLGFDADRVVVMMLEWNETLPAGDREAIYEAVLTRVDRLPEVQQAGLTYTIPFYSSISLGQPRVPGLDSVPRHHNGGPYVNKVGAGYMEAMGLSVVSGRGIETIDDSDAASPVAVVSQSMANAYWPEGDAIGSCMIFNDDEPVCTEVVGVVENHRRQALIEDDPHFLYYVNRAHPDFEGPPQALMIGTRGEPEIVLQPLRDEARATSPQVRFVAANSLADFVEPELRSWTLGASMFTVFGILALLVAAWGLYSVLAFDVALRRHEMGVRTALGAGVSRIVHMVLRRALLLVGVGTVLGLLAAIAAGPLLRPLLFRVSDRDPTTYLMVAVVLLIVGCVSGAVPALRATRVDPREALAAE